MTADPRSTEGRYIVVAPKPLLSDGPALAVSRHWYSTRDELPTWVSPSDVERTRRFVDEARAREFVARTGDRSWGLEVWAYVPGTTLAVAVPS